MDQSIQTSEFHSPLKPALLQGIILKTRRLWNEYNYLLLAALIPAALMYLMYVARLIHPFGNQSVLVLDLTGQYQYFYAELQDALAGDGNLLYSFSRTLGGEFLGIFAYYIASPFALILGLFPEQYLLEGLLTIFLLKTALCGFSMGFLLHKISKNHNKLTIITFSLMYALCSYAVVQQHNSMWIDAVLWLPILVYAIQELIKFGHFRLFVAVFALTLFSNFYIGYMVCIFVVIYCFYYYFAHNANNENNPTGEKGHFLKSVIRMAGWSALAIGIAAVIILSAQYSLSFGKDDFTVPNWAISQNFEIFEFLYKFLPSSYDTVTPRGLPFVYCGVLTLIMAPAFFLCKKFSNREKIAAAIVIFVLVASMGISTLDLIWHGFQKPNWLNYRYSFMLSFFLVMLAFRAFEQIQFINRRSLLFVSAFIGFFALLAQQLSDTLFTEAIEAKDVSAVFRPYATIWLTIGCLFLYMVILCLHNRTHPKFREGLSTVLLVVVCIELFISGLCDINSLDADVTYGKYNKYTDHVKIYHAITDAVYEQDDGFYRMESTYHVKMNDNFILDIRGLTNSTSTLDLHTLEFVNSMGYFSQSHKSRYYMANPVADSLMGIKYIISNPDMMDERYGPVVLSPEDYDFPDDISYPEDTGSFSKSNCDDLHVYQNLYALSMIYGVNDAWMDYERPSYSSPFNQMNDMITAMLGEDETVQVFKPAIQKGDPVLNDVKKSTLIPSGSDIEHIRYTGKGGTLTYQYTVPEDTELYFYYPLTNQPSISRYRYTVNLAINGKGSIEFGDNDTNRIQNLGTVSSSDMTLEVTLASSSLYVKPEASYVYYIDWEVFEDAMARLKAQPQMIIDGDCTDDHLIGTMTTTADRQAVFTSIPSDDGWHVYVDGHRVETYETANALLSFYVEGAGEHEIELKYRPSCFTTGITISIICLIIFLVLAIGSRWLRRIPLLKHVFGIQCDALPTIDSPEMLLEMTAGDIGYSKDDAPADHLSTPPKSNNKKNHMR